MLTPGKSAIRASKSAFCQEYLQCLHTRLYFGLFFELFADISTYSASYAGSPLLALDGASCRLPS